MTDSKTFFSMLQEGEADWLRSPTISQISNSVAIMKRLYATPVHNYAKTET
ncbi:hypothetical protein [Clostridium sp. 1xD42-85]|uniref:hypothetical protein n=1 Tax=Clostridium sp. 1xD42-85 TaxID=2320084 RepID=UPI001A9BF348|nr:hypothetical protein [Clostridium sp. 1xD42-85]